MKILGRWLPLLRFRGSESYWQRRYRLGGDSGVGSRGAAAAYKAAVLNDFVERHGVTDVIEFGCGDGEQLTLADYPSYFGLDVSRHAVELCRQRFSDDSTKRFALLDEYADETADLAISLDVLFHLVEDEVYAEYLDRLFGAARRFVVIYSTSVEPDEAAATLRHVRHRPVESDVAEWFQGFARMTEWEGSIPDPVVHAGGVPTRFLGYRRVG
jgi:SAM-dependent methyltransferase